MSTIEILSNNIINRRRKLDMSVKELSAASGVSVSYINRLEKGNDVPASVAINICGALRTNIDEMI